MQVHTHTHTHTHTQPRLKWAKSLTLNSGEFKSWPHESIWLLSLDSPTASKIGAQLLLGGSTWNRLGVMFVVFYFILILSRELYGAPFKNYRLINRLQGLLTQRFQLVNTHMAGSAPTPEFPIGWSGWGLIKCLSEKVLGDADIVGSGATF